MGKCQLDTFEGSEPMECVREIKRRARKSHRCCECGDDIRPGDVYEYTSGISEHEPVEFKTCDVCAEIRHRIFCTWTYTLMWEDLAEESVFTLSLAGLSEAAIDKLQRFWGRNIGESKV